jgi:hypothetical protein
MAEKMYSRHGLPLLRRPIPKRAVWSERARAVRTMLAGWPPPARQACVLILLVLLALCAGCATSSPPSVPAANPAPPRLSEPLPSATYSDSARKLIEIWRNALTGM